MRDNTQSGDMNGFTHELDVPINARYVKLTVLGNNTNGGAHICELIVRGDESAERAEEKYDQDTDFTPLASIRLERFRDGIEDYELLKLYAEKVGRAESLELLKTVYTDPKTFTNSFDKIEEMRKEIFEALD